MPNSPSTAQRAASSPEKSWATAAGARIASAVRSEPAADSDATTSAPAATAPKTASTPTAIRLTARAWRASAPGPGAIRVAGAVVRRLCAVNSAMP
jgi:hypothetical protein